MTTVLIAHHPKEVELAQEVASHLESSGYVAWHRGSVYVGDSIPAEVSKLLGTGCPVVLVATERAMGASWTRRLANAVQTSASSRLYALHVEQDADVEAVTFGEVVAQYWSDPAAALAALTLAIGQRYPPATAGKAARAARERHLETRYRQLLLELCDIVDLANLPESDRHIATRQLELRRLYVSLRVVVKKRAARAPSVATAEADVAPSEVPARSPSGTREARVRATAVDAGASASVRVAAPSSIPGDGTADESTSAETEHPNAEAVGARGRGAGQAAAEDLKEPEPGSVGDLLREGSRLVVLGDPGAGKTTLLRWIASAYLLRLGADPDFTGFPDVESLPEADWLPILIRCRDMDEPAARGNFGAMLQRSLEKADLDSDEATELAKLLRRRLLDGTAILLIDGIDEIANPRTRIEFCTQLERSIRSFVGPVIITSRVVGYRDLDFSLDGFDHAEVAALRPEDKDFFAEHWATLTEPPDRVNRTASELMADIHSSERIEQLTDNPLLLTTMALVRRKIGRLPSRRVELYREAVELLLRWRSQVDDPIEQREALPQLRYLAYHMCSVGVQRLARDDTLTVLGQFRSEFPNLYEAHAHSPTEFLKLVEGRTALLVEAGYEKHGATAEPVYEFRHLTIQEYLAGAALVEEHVPDRRPDERLSDRVGPLAGRTTASLIDGRPVVVDNWNEALRLCLSMAPDREVDQTVLAVLRPLPGEARGVARARAELALQVLGDEPAGLSDATAAVVLDTALDFVGDGGDRSASEGLLWALHQLRDTRWQGLARSRALAEFATRAAVNDGDLEYLLQPAHLAVALTSVLPPQHAPDTWASLSNAEALEEAVRLVAYRSDRYSRSNVEADVAQYTEAIVSLLSRETPLDLLAALVASHLLGGWRWHYWISNDLATVRPPELARQVERVPVDRPSLDVLLEFFVDYGGTDNELSRRCLESSRPVVRLCALRGFVLPLQESDLAVVVARFQDPDPSVRARAVDVAGSRAATNDLVKLLADDDPGVRSAAVSSLAPVATSAELPDLLKRLSDSDEGVAEATAQSIVARDEAGDVSSIVHVLEHGRPAARRRAAWMLGRTKAREAGVALADRLADKNRDVKCAAATALGELADERWVPDLIAVTGDRDGEVRAAAVEAIANIPEAEIGALMDLVTDRSEKVRGHIAWIFADVEPIEDGVQVLMDLLHDRASSVRQQVALSLGHVGATRGVAVRDALKGLLTDRSSNVRADAFRALVKVGTVAESANIGADGELARVDVAEFLRGRTGQRMVETLDWLSWPDEPLADWMRGLVSEQLQARKEDVRRAAVALLARKEDEQSRRLLSRDLDGLYPWIDPAESIERDAIARAADVLSISEDEVRWQYEALAEGFGLVLAG